MKEFYSKHSGLIKMLIALFCFLVWTSPMYFIKQSESLADQKFYHKEDVNIRFDNQRTFIEDQIDNCNITTRSLISSQSESINTRLDRMEDRLEKRIDTLEDRIVETLRENR